MSTRNRDCWMLRQLRHDQIENSVKTTKRGCSVDSESHTVYSEGWALPRKQSRNASGRSVGLNSKRRLTGYVVRLPHIYPPYSLLCSFTFIAPRNSVKAHVRTRVVAQDSKLTACIRFRRSGISWNAKIIHDWLYHTVIHPPDTPHPDSPTTLRFPRVSENPAPMRTLTIGRECPCLSSFVCARAITASRGSAGRKIRYSGTRDSNSGFWWTL